MSSPFPARAGVRLLAAAAALGALSACASSEPPMTYDDETEAAESAADQMPGPLNEPGPPMIEMTPTNPSDAAPGAVVTQPPTLDVEDAPPPEG